MGMAVELTLLLTTFFARKTPLSKGKEMFLMLWCLDLFSFCTNFFQLTLCNAFFPAILFCLGFSKRLCECEKSHKPEMLRS